MKVTHFRETAARLAHLLVEAAVDHEAFERPMKPCRLTVCRATCCHDGVVLSAEEAGYLSGEAEGEGVIRTREGKWRTEVRSAGPGELAADFPAHFPRTRCHFLDEQHRCRWQLKSVAEGRHPWFYKPISCWMHPLVLQEEGGRPVLTVVSREEDRDGFASHTPCGAVQEGGVAARECLRAELDMLGEISGRDFYGELNAPPAFT
mgnify:CR=1 FL=1